MINVLLHNNRTSIPMRLILILLLLATPVEAGMRQEARSYSKEDSVQVIEGTASRGRITNKETLWWIEWVTREGMKHYITSDKGDIGSVDLPDENKSVALKGRMKL
jgi:hypothetical protein